MLKKTTRWITAALNWFCLVAMLGLTVIVALQVISRLLKISLPWTEELARFLIVWLTFLGCTLAIYRKGHLSVNFLVEMMPKGLQRAANLITRAVLLVFFAMLLFYGVRLSALSMNNMSVSLNWPMGAVYAVLPFSALLAIYYVVLDILDTLGVDVPTYEKEASEE